MDGDAPSSVPDELDDEPAAAEEVYIALFTHGPDVTAQKIAKHTSVSKRQVRNHLDTLADLGLVESRPDFSGGARWRYVYSLAED